MPSSPTKSTGRNTTKTETGNWSVGQLVSWSMAGTLTVGASADAPGSSTNSWSGSSLDLQTTVLIRPSPSGICPPREAARVIADARRLAQRAASRQAVPITKNVAERGFAAVRHEVTTGAASSTNGTRSSERCCESAGPPRGDRVRAARRFSGLSGPRLAERDVLRSNAPQLQNA